VKRVLITGPTGSIGIALIKELIRQKIEVIAVCRNGSARIRNIPQHELVTIVECDLCQLLSLDIAAVGRIDILYHFGWDGTFGNSRNNMQGQLQNIQYSLDAVELAEKLGCSTFIGAGSQAEYGRTENMLNAFTPTFPENGYGIAKLCAGQMTRILCQQKGIRHIWTRILSVYGPYDGEKTMIMSLIGTLLKSKKPSLTKGEQQWDYLYSKDAAKAMYLLGERGVSGKIYCLGSGRIQPLHTYIEKIRDRIAPSAELGIGEIPYAPQQVMYLCADIRELTGDTGFMPRYTFEEGIQETIDWYIESRKERHENEI